MRRNVVRLVFAIVATSMLAACADMPTAPKAPTAPRAAAGEEALTCSGGPVQGSQTRC